MMRSALLVSLAFIAVLAGCSRDSQHDAVDQAKVGLVQIATELQKVVKTSGDLPQTVDFAKLMGKTDWGSYLGPDCFQYDRTGAFSCRIPNTHWRSDPSGAKNAWKKPIVLVVRDIRSADWAIS